MALCPVCNALKEIKMYCSVCGISLDDSGKVSDFLDPYAHYYDEEIKSIEGSHFDATDTHKCTHLMYCQHCGHQQVAVIQEE